MNNPVDLFSRVERVLLVQLSAIGDVLRAGSVVDTLRRRYPKLRVGMAVFSDYEEVVAGIPGLHYRHVFPNIELKREMNAAQSDDEALKAVYKNVYLPIEEMRLRNYDLAVNLHFSTISGYIAALSGARILIGMACGPVGEFDVFGLGARALYDDLASPHRQARSRDHLAIRYHRMCQLPETAVRLRYEIPPGTDNPLLHVKRRLTGPGGRPVAIHIGGGWRDKCWDAAKWRELIRRIHCELGWTMVLVGTIVERERKFAEVLRDINVPVIDFCGYSFFESAKVLSSCGLFIGADSGPMHLASALDVPTVAMFGPTSAAESYPLCGRNAVIKKSRMADISVDEVWPAIAAVTGRNQTRSDSWADVFKGRETGVFIYENSFPPAAIQKNVA